MASPDSELRALLDRQREAFRAKNIERVMALYAPDIVYFDLVPPLRYTGSTALRKRFSDWFELWASPINMEIRDLHLLASAEVAAASMLIRTSGTLKSGREVGYWVRASDSYQRSERGWLITHEHVSLPVDMANGSAVMNLLP
jgi:ketosteroid isomerase-like protein